MEPRIRIVTPWYGEFAGGAESAARGLAEHLLDSGLDVQVFTTCSRSPFDDWWSDHYCPKYYEINGVPVRRFSVNKEMKDQYHRLNTLMLDGLDLSIEEQFSFMRGNINSHELISHIKWNRQFYYVFLPYLYGTTFWGVNAATDRSIIIPCLHDEPIAKWEIVKDMFTKANKLIFLTQEEKLLAQELYGSRIDMMPVAGIGVESKLNFDASIFRAKFKIEDPFLIYVGRKDKGKNIVLLIDYFIRYISIYSNKMKMVFIGGGDSSLIPSNNSNFIDLSFVTEQDKLDAIAASVALCNLSDNESFSLAIMESWITWTPVIVSARNRVTTSHCEKSNGGCIVSNENEFCESVNKLKTASYLTKTMGAYGREYVKENYSWNKIINKYLQIFKELK